MRTVGMLRGGTGASCLLLVLVIGCTYALPLQLLPEVPGYIPVYIRHGDQPLEEINPGLAEAFHERNSHSKNIRQIHVDHMSRESDESSSPEDETISEKNDGSIYVVPPVKPLSMNRLHADNNDMTSERLYHRRPIEVPKNSILTVAEMSEDEEIELASLVAEIEREEMKPNDLFDTSDSNPLYLSQTHGETSGRRVQHQVGSMEARPVSKWSDLQESQRNAKEQGPITYDRVPDESGSRQNSDEESKQDSDEEYYGRVKKTDDQNNESESSISHKKSDHSDERITDEVAEE